jgi:CheY-like chemotaxis protein
MATKLNTVLLIDDDLTINYFHNRLIEKSSLTENIAISKNGKEGLDSFLELNEKIEGEEMTVVFLDLNMPIMNGWEFLDNLSKIKEGIKMKYKIFILSSTINPDDKKKAKNHALVTGFLSKPLTKENLESITLEHFQ